MPLSIPATPARVRIAPSPTGDPHVGTAYVALFNKALAAKSGGQFLLRIEDTDRTRLHEGSEQQIFDALRWLGLTYDEGPDVGGPCAPYRQSERTAIYLRAVDDLLARRKAYRCFCTPEDLDAMREHQKAHKLPLGYDGRCRDLTDAVALEKRAAGLPFVVRLAVPRAGSTTFEDGLRGEVTFAHEQVDDQVLLKSDGFPTYHLANVVDDHQMGITHVLRGEEWISSTPKHVLLYEAFGWTAPVFVHLPLLRKADKNRSKLSKRKDPVSILWYRDQGFLEEALLNFLGLMGYSMPDGREVFSLEEFLAEFDPSRLRTTGPAFDLTKLEWLNGEWIRRLPVDALIARIHRLFGDRYAGQDDLMRRILPHVQERMKKLSDWPQATDLFFVGLPDYDPALLTPKKVDAAKADEILSAVAAAIEGSAAFDAASLEALGREQAEALSVKIGPCFMVLRVAVTGSNVSPPLFETMEVLGKDETLRRLAEARSKLAGAAKP